MQGPFIFRTQAQQYLVDMLGAYDGLGQEAVEFLVGEEPPFGSLLQKGLDFLSASRRDR